MADANQAFLDMFDDPERVAAYAEGPPRYMLGYEAVQRMAGILLAERSPADAHVLVLGAGGGLELKALATMKPAWRFTGVDPAGPMLDLARVALGRHAGRAALVQGTIDAAPPGPFDAATCLLTLHFLPREERVRTLAEMRRRLRPGAPLVVAHASFAQHEPARSSWLARYGAYRRRARYGMADAAGQHRHGHQFHHPGSGHRCGSPPQAGVRGRRAGAGAQDRPGRVLTTERGGSGHPAH